MVVIGLFWWMRLSGASAVAPGSRRPVNPIANIRRYVSQPRLRLAWLVAFGRSCYWMTFYIYAPILMVVTGEGKLAGGLIVSLGNALLLFAIIWGRLGSRIGVRRVVVFAFGGAAICSILAGWTGEANPWLTALLVLAGVNFAVALDAVGNVPFLRARARLRARADDGGAPHQPRPFGAAAGVRLQHRPRLFRAWRGVRRRSASSARYAEWWPGDICRAPCEWNAKPPLAVFGSEDSEPAQPEMTLG